MNLLALLALLALQVLRTLQSEKIAVREGSKRPRTQTKYFLQVPRVRTIRHPPVSVLTYLQDRSPTYHALPAAVYGPLESKARLDSQGFDSRVTSLSPSQYVAIWFKMADRTMAKPSRSDFVSASSSSQITIPGKAQHRRVTQVRFIRID